MWSIELEVGQTYFNRNGDAVEIIGKNKYETEYPATEYPYYDADGNTYRRDGVYCSSRDEFELDLISIVPIEMNEWSTEFPTEEGRYWFHGYRFGKISCGEPREPELMVVSVYPTATGTMYIANGYRMYKSEVECPHFMKMDVPPSPTYEEES